MNHNKIETALHYASLGWAVLPINHMTPQGQCYCGKPLDAPKHSPGKHPYAPFAPNGLHSASSDSATISKWFSSMPFNIGIATGTISGIWVLDIDGDEGAAVLARLEEKHGKLPDTLRAQTGGGGRHYYFCMPTGVEIRNSEKKIGTCIDVRGTGGYAVAPGSNHISGKPYEWENCEQPSLDKLVDAPEWLLTLIVAASRTSDPWAPKGNEMFANLRPAFVWPDKIKDGEGRESFIIKASGHLRRINLDQAVIERILLDYNRAHNEPPLDDATVLDRTRRYNKAKLSDAANDIDWPEPEEISATLPPVPPFEEDMLPPVFRARLSDVAERMQCPIEFLAVGAMVAAGAVVGNRIGVQPKRRDTGWVEVANLWGAVVGRPGVMKSPALAQVLAPLQRLEANALAAFSTTRAHFEIDRMQHEAAIKHLEASARKGKQILPGQFPVKPEEPQPPRLLLNDATYQKLGQVLSGNPHGVMVFQDELSGLLVRLDADGQEAARGFYLEAWNGQQPYVFDRIERGTVRIPRLCFSLLGGLQPSKLREYLRSAVYGGKGDDGLAQRLQLLVYPDISTDWKRIDRLPDMAAAAAADAAFDQLANLDPAALGAHMPFGDGIPVLCFSDDAQHMFNIWWEHLEKSMRQGEQHPALESHMSKYRKLVPAMSLLDHLILGTHGSIQIESLRRAIRWQRFLFEHAKRAYAAVTLATMDSAKALSGRVLRGALKDGFTVREVYRHNWSMLSTAKEAAEAVAVLVDLGWLRHAQDTQQTNTDGRPTVRYFINPRLKAAA